MFTSFILTAPRPGNVSYLNQMLLDYHLAFDNKPHIFAEPGDLNLRFPSRATVHKNPTRLGIVENWLNAARYCWAHTNSDWFLAMEDDIRIEPSVATRLRSIMLNNEVGPVKINDIGFVSPYCCVRNCYENVRRDNPGWYRARMTGCGWCGCLMLLIPRSSLFAIVDNADRIRELAKGVNLDYALGEFLTVNCKKQLITHMPTLVRHDGHVSTNERNNCNVARVHESRKPAL